MENQSDSRILRSIRSLNKILSPSGNRVLLLDFSHFLAVSSQYDNIIVKTCGLPQCLADYEATLEKAYATEGFVKYKVDESEREKLFVYDFSERAPVTSPDDYSFSPKRNLDKHKVKVKAETEVALKWFEAVKQSGMCGSGVVIARDTPSMQSNIYLFLEKKLGVKSPGAVEFYRRGGTESGVEIADETREVLVQVFRELNELLRDEMEETAARLYGQYFNNVSFISHEIRNAETNIVQASDFTSAQAFGLGLCIALSVGVKLGSGPGDPGDKVEPIDIQHVKNFLEAYRQFMMETDAAKSLESSFTESLQQIERWQACVIMEITRNTQRDVVGTIPHRVRWKVETDGDGVIRMCCTSAPHAIDDPSAWPWRGNADQGSMKGTDFIARLADSQGYVATWEPRQLAEDPGFWEARFELKPRGNA